MLFGNRDCVLAYDGYIWQKIEIPGGDFIRALVMDEAGTIWVGGVNCLGQLVLNGNDYEFKPMAQLVPESAKPFGDCWGAIAQGNRIYISTNKALLLLRNGAITPVDWPSGTGFSWLLFASSNKLFAHARGQPLFEVVDNQFVPTIDAKVLNNSKVEQVLEPAPGVLLLLTKDRGILRIQDRTVEPFPTEADASHTEGLLLAGDNGVLLMTEGRPFRQLYETNGSVWELTRSKKDPDRFFLGTTNGLASIRFVDGNWIDEGTLPGFRGEVRSVVEEANGDLYFSALGSGFYHVKLQSGAHSIFEGASWKSLSDAHGYPSVAGVTHLVAWGNQLLFKTDDGAYLYDDRNHTFSEPEFLANAVNHQKLEALCASTVGFPHIYLLTSGSETSSFLGKHLSVIYADGKVKSIPCSIPDFIGHIDKFYDEIGSQGSVLWVAGTYGIARIENPDSLPPPFPFNLYAQEATNNNGETVLVPHTGGTLRLSYSERNFRIRFAADAFVSSDQMRFRSDEPLSEPVPTPEEIQQLILSAQRGDVMALRTQIDRLGTSDVAYRIFCQRLKLIAAEFRMGAIQTLLQRAAQKRDNAPVHGAEPKHQ